ncbi:MAG: histidine phosphatase family protein [Xanthomonadaceae bacterium]|nr:histidine phosphatase family protein [Xanthomonadaceae bacterium]
MMESLRRLVLIRHAQGSLGSDDYDQLSPVGYIQARHLAEHVDRLAPAAPVVRGELRRHRQTADCFGAEVCDIDAGLNEYRVDHLLNAAYADAARLAIELPAVEALADPRAYLQTFLDRFPEVLEAWQCGRLRCEMNGLWSAFGARVEAAGKRLAQRFDQSGTVLSVTSAGVISTLAAHLLERDLVWQRRLNISLYNASITELHLGRDGRWRAERLNCVDHLPPGELHTLA